MLKLKFASRPPAVTRSHLALEALRVPVQVEGPQAGGRLLPRLGGDRQLAAGALGGELPANDNKKNIVYILPNG